MPGLVGLIVTVIIIGVLIWGAQRILKVIPVAEPFRTIAYVLIVVLAVLLLVDAFGLWPGALHLGRGCI